MTGQLSLATDPRPASRIHHSLMRLSGFLILSLCVLIAVHANASPSAGSPASVNSVGHPDILSHALLLEDENNELSWRDIAQRHEGWTPVNSNAISPGISTSTWWLHFRLINTESYAVDLVLDLGNSRQDYATLYLFDGAAELRIVPSGDRLPYRERPLLTRHIALPFQMAAGAALDIYLQLQSYDGLFEAMPIQLLGAQLQASSATASDVMLSLFHGGLLLLAVYHLLIFGLTRERAFGFYVFFLLSVGLWSFTFSGFSYQYLWPEQIRFNHDFLTLIVGLAFAGYGLFAMEYLRLRQSPVRWPFRVLQTLTGLNVLIGFSALLGFYMIAVVAGWIAGVAIIIAVTAAALWQMSQESAEARLFLLGFSLLGTGAIAYIMQIIGWLPVNWFTTWGIYLGITVQVLLLALGLADSVNKVRAQALETEKLARNLQREQAGRLELLVEERTASLNRLNRQLRELAVTDELTGAFNRRYFNEICQALLQERNRPEPLALCMFDFDHFKHYNDFYGHQAGDKALRDVAHAIQFLLTRSDDRLFRLGGEEFGILFTAPSLDAATRFMERLRKAVNDLQIVHEDTAEGILTVSFGLAWWQAESLKTLTPDAMYLAADRLLYDAKAAGRNCVVGAWLQESLRRDRV